MDSFTRRDLRRLAEEAEGPSASIYLPTHRSGREVRQNRLRFKNLLKSAKEQLSDRFPDDRALKQQLDKAAALEADNPWWQHQSDGLAIFLARDRFDRYRIPLDFKELVSVGRRFYVRPMVRVLQGDGRFYILAVSQNKVRLLQGTRYRVDELDPEGLPSDLRSALHIDEYVSSLQQHSTGGAETAGTMTFHGQGGADMDVQKKDEIRQYFHRIDAALDAYFGPEQTPLVFAGVDYLYPIFREKCHYDGLLDRPVTGNPDDLPADDLHRQAWEVVGSAFTQELDAAVARFRADKDDHNATAELGEVIRAARQGAVDTLMVTNDRQRWGVVDEPSGRVELTEKNDRDAEELLNYAAVYTLTGGGTVYSLPEDKMPDGQEAAALLRFSVASA